VTVPHTESILADERPAPVGPPHGAERRRNPRLRALVDEMLEVLRATLREELASDAARVDAERQLERIMTRVRAEAVRRGAAG
jgi:hypothetical protein